MFNFIQIVDPLFACESGTNPCDQICVVDQQTGSPVCSCLSGYTINADEITCDGTTYVQH